MEVWGKRAPTLVVINSCADLFSSAAYQCLQQESMSVNALSRPLDAVAKSIKHNTAMSTILTIDLFHARRDAKILVDHSSHALRNAPMKSQLLFNNKIKQVAKSTLETQQHRFLASSACNLRNHLIQLQVLSGNLDSLLNRLDLNRIKHIGITINHNLLCLILEMIFLRLAET